MVPNVTHNCLTVEDALNHLLQVSEVYIEVSYESRLPCGDTCCYNVFTVVILFYQVSYIMLFFYVHTNYYVV